MQCPESNFSLWFRGAGVSPAIFLLPTKPKSAVRRRRPTNPALASAKYFSCENNFSSGIIELDTILPEFFLDFDSIHS
jgi:hypothetical protein